MVNSLIDYIIPENTKGKATSVEHSLDLENVAEAKAIFTIACSRMLNVNLWHKLSGFASAKFSLKDTNGISVERPAQAGDYLQIDIPGPGPASGNGYDWVQVEVIENKTNENTEQESYGMRVRSSKNPNKNEKDIAHFFTGDSTSTFIIHRRQNIVTSSYNGRNEVINTDTEKVIDKIRNAATGATALIGISEIQWSTLIKSFIEKED